jgi:A/G-specific adenine glycosylase
MEKENIGLTLLHWYQNNARDLPWRRARDPYRIWISEVMLQQTRVEMVIPYYEKWLSVFPDLNSLGNAEEDQVLKIWEGLGYYSRARRILKAAHILISEYGGKFPREIKELKKLPGIGDYIAAALGSIAFGWDEAALDGNGLRVFARLVEYPHPINEAGRRAELKQIMQETLPEGYAGEFNQAVMDLGSQICTTRKPDCEHCPIRSGCLAFKHSSQDVFPLKLSKKKLPHYDVVAAVIWRGNEVLIDKRKADGLLGGLWEFPGGKVESGEDHHSALVREIKEELGVDFSVERACGSYQHAYTHFKVTVYVFVGKITHGEPAALAADEIRWVPVEELSQYPMGKVDRLISLSL